QGVELVVDLGLAAGAHLVVAALELEAGVGQVGRHLVAQVDVVVVRGHREVAALGADLVTEVGGAVRVGRGGGGPRNADPGHRGGGAAHGGRVGGGGEEV